MSHVRVGLVVPSSNVTVETELPALLGRHPSATFSFHGSRMRMAKVSFEQLAAMNAQRERCILELGDADPDVILYACLVALMAAAKEIGSGDALKMRPVAERYGWTDQPAFSEKAFTLKTGGVRPYDTESYAIVYDGWKLIHNTRRSDGVPEFELFDHKKDPLNRQNVADQHPDVVKRLTPKLEERRHLAVAAALPANSATKMSPEEMQRLRGLGYIQ